MDPATCLWQEHVCEKIATHRATMRGGGLLQRSRQHRDSRLVGGEGGSRDDEWRRGTTRASVRVCAAAEDFLHESGVLLFLRSFARAATGPHTRHQCHTELSFYA